MTSCEDCESNRCAACGDYSEEARLYREFLARHLPEYDMPEYDKSDDCNNVFTEKDERELEAATALQRLLDEEEELERSYRERTKEDDFARLSTMRKHQLEADAAQEAKKPHRYVIHATRVTTSGWGERVTQIPLFYIDGNVQGCRTVEEAVAIAKVILPDDDVATDSAHRTVHHIAAFEL